MRLIDLAVAIALGLVSVIGVSNAQTADDKAALQGLKEVKLVFDVTTADAKPLLNVLTVIEETRASLIKQGVTPTIVVAFRGPATKLVQSNQSQMKPEDREHAAAIASRIKALSTASGIEGVEQCGVAIRIAGTKSEDVVPGVKVVGNSWISLAAYQARGFGYVTP
jgi:intracellular sulfur oxidation DsrE/DsrF family protein